MRYLTEEAIVNEARRSGEVLSLRKVLRLLRRELKGLEKIGVEFFVFRRAQR